MRASRYRRGCRALRAVGPCCRRLHGAPPRRWLADPRRHFARRAASRRRRRGSHLRGGGLHRVLGLCRSRRLAESESGSRPAGALAARLPDRGHGLSAVVDQPIAPAPPPVSLLSAPRSLSRARGSLKSDRASLTSRLEDSESAPVARESDPRSGATVLKMRKK